MDYKNKIRSHIKSGKLKIRALRTKERHQFYEEVNSVKPFTLSSIRYLVQLFRHDGNRASIHSPLLAEAIRHHITDKGYMSAGMVFIIQSLVRRAHKSNLKITRPLADFLFDLNETVADSENNHSAWSQFFANTVSKHLLEDSPQPDEINEEEANWLIERILSDGQYDYVEQALLPMLEKKAKKIPETLRFQMQLLNGVTA